MSPAKAIMTVRHANDKASIIDIEGEVTSAAENALPQFQIGQHSFSRLIVGANPFNAGSHLSNFVNREMRAYYTPDRIVETLRLDSNQRNLAEKERRSEVVVAYLAANFFGVRSSRNVLDLRIRDGLARRCRDAILH